MESANENGKEVVTGSEVSEETKAKALSTFLTALDYEEKNLHTTQELLARQKSLNTVYQRSLSYQSSSSDRKKAIGYRNSIAKANIDYTVLQTLWTVSLIKYLVLFCLIQCWYKYYTVYNICVFLYDAKKKLDML